MAYTIGEGPWSNASVVMTAEDGEHMYGKSAAFKMTNEVKMSV